MVLLIYLIYVSVLFAVMAYNEFAEERSISRGLNGLGSSLSLFFHFIEISFFASTAFLIVVHAIRGRVSLSFILLAPFLNVLVAMLIGILVGFVLCITQLEKSISNFQKIFIVASFSTTATTLWLLGDLFKSQPRNEDMRIT